jgi:H+/Cl- antiporter ClcA
MPYADRTLIAAFVSTALWDVVLRQISAGHVPVPIVRDFQWVKVLRPYFQRHTVLSAALIAGFVGAVTYAIIAPTWTIIRNTVSTSPAVSETIYVVYVALISGVVGLGMRASSLFPHLTKYYYDRLPMWYSFGSDMFSGLVVYATLMTLAQIFNAS